MLQSKIYDQNSIYQAVADLIYIDCDELRRKEAKKTVGSSKRQLEDNVEKISSQCDSKKRKLSRDLSVVVQHDYSDKFDR